MVGHRKPRQKSLFCYTLSRSCQGHITMALLLTPYGLSFGQILVPLHLRRWNHLHVHGRRFVWSSDSICVLAGYQGEVFGTIRTRTSPQLFGTLWIERVFKDDCQADGKITRPSAERTGEKGENRKADLFVLFLTIGVLLKQPQC